MEHCSLYAPEDGYSIDDSPEIPPEIVTGLLDLIDKLDNNADFRNFFTDKFRDF